ncbi:universal stress protein [Kaistia adipata]|uniref:universal stress protein n=1 Tax=Kaistia adipata TaxID=166954 RepID=UPI001FDFA2A5|nr:universal stress protein [Kaistia adipata]
MITYPDIVPDESVTAAVDVAASLGLSLQSTAFSVEIPRMSSLADGFLINISELVRATEANSQADCLRLRELVLRQAGGRIEANCTDRKVALGLTGEAAAVEARYFDLSILPWAKDKPVIQETAQAVVFESGRPGILVPPAASSMPVKHVAIAWDGGRAAARALGDAMPILAQGASATVLTVQDEKPLEGHGIAEALAVSLKRRGIRAEARGVTLNGRRIAEALQEAALDAGAGLLVMGGFGHSRMRDFILGGATKGVFADLRLPVLLSH